MSYLDIARRVDFGTKETKEVPIDPPAGSGDVSPGYERNEFNEKSLDLSVQGAELLKAEIIAALDVEPSDFNRDRYELLVAQLAAHERNAP